MDDDLTAAQRILWAKNHSGKTWEAIAADLGCTHSALIQWSKGQTDVMNARAGLLTKFAQCTGVNLHWLLTGMGERVVRYVRTEHQLIQEARHIVAERPALAEGAYKMLLALESISLQPDGKAT